MKIGIVGLGLIGGSIAKELTTRSLGTIHVYGIDNNPVHAKRAKELKLVEQVIDLEDAIGNCEVFIVAIPVNAIEAFLPSLLDKIGDKDVVIDVGSTKGDICTAIKNHPKRNRFVAAHPLAGTEFSGPDAAVMNLFHGKKNIICEKELSDEDAVSKALRVFDFLGMNTFYMESNEHDKHMAFVSHLSHVTSFALSQTVLEIEQDEKQILNLASTGFESTVRLAKCNPTTWTAIFEKNPEYLGQAIDTYIKYLKHYQKLVEERNWEGMYDSIKASNEIKRVLDGIKINTLTK